MRSFTTGDSKRTGLAVALGDLHPLDRVRPVAAVRQAGPEFGETALRVMAELLDALTIHARRPFVARDTMPRQVQGMRTSDFIDQAEPLASFDAVAQRRHHAIRPDRAFRPPQIMGSHPGCVCPLPSRLGTLGILLARSTHLASSFLPPFPRGGLCCPSLSTARSGRGTIKALTPPGLTQAGGSLRLLRLAVPTFRPQPRDPPPGRFVSRLSATGCSRLRRPRGGSPRYPAETGSSSYGLPIHLRLLSTPPRGDAVTFNFWTCDQPRHGLAPCRQSVLTDALMAGLVPAINASNPRAPRSSRQHPTRHQRAYNETKTRPDPP